MQRQQGRSGTFCRVRQLAMPRLEPACADVDIRWNGRRAPHLRRALDHQVVGKPGPVIDGHNALQLLDLVVGWQGEGEGGGG